MRKTRDDVARRGFGYDGGWMVLSNSPTAKEIENADVSCYEVQDLVERSTHCAMLSWSIHRIGIHPNLSAVDGRQSSPSELAQQVEQITLRYGPEILNLRHPRKAKKSPTVARRPSTSEA